jgi:quercetin dioxygenase-like cupin family protein
VKATSESTRGAYSMKCSTAAPGHGTPYHLHQEEDEAFYVLEREFTSFSEGKKTILRSGGYIFLPRRIRCTGSAPSTMLILTMPGSGFMGMMSARATDIEKLNGLCAKYRIDVLGPLPE